MKPAVRRAFCRRGPATSSVPATAGAAGAAFANSLVTDDDLDALTQNVRTRVEAVGAEDHRPARRRRRAGADDVPADPHRHQPGPGRLRRGPRRRQRDATRWSLKSRLLGENPCNVDKVFRKIKQFGGHARQAGGVCGDRDGADGSGRQGVGRAVLADARRQVPRSRAALCRHDRAPTIRRSRAQR